MVVVARHAVSRGVTAVPDMILRGSPALDAFDRPWLGVIVAAVWPFVRCLLQLLSFQSRFALRPGIALPDVVFVPVQMALIVAVTDRGVILPGILRGLASGVLHIIRCIATVYRCVGACAPAGLIPDEIQRSDHNLRIVPSRLMSIIRFAPCHQTSYAAHYLKISRMVMFAIMIDRRTPNEITGRQHAAHYHIDAIYSSSKTYNVCFASLNAAERDLKLR